MSKVCRSCESKGAVASFRYRPQGAAWLVPRTPDTMQPSGAVGGFTESVAREVASFGVKMCALEPGGIRTNRGARANENTPGLLPEYEPSVGAAVNTLKSYWGHETSDPDKVAQVVLRLAASDSLPVHV